MNQLKFVLYLAAFLGGIAALSVLIDRLAMPDEDAARLSYHEILLAETPSPRLIVESGSNSWYGVVPEMIEAAFNRPAIVIADYAGVPLEMKIKRLERYAKEGDVIILPLEWEYYFKVDYPSDFIENVVHDTLNSAAYYYDLKPLDRFRFIVSNMNIHYLVEGLKQRHSDAHSLSIQKKLKDVLEDMKRGVGGDVKRDWLRQLNVKGLNCQEFIGARGDVPLSKVVGWAANQLAALQAQRHVKIFVTWPAVAGTACYEQRSAEALTSKIREIFGNAGIRVVGDPDKLIFPIDHALDTYYHVDLAAAQVRTAQMINDLAGGGLSRWSEPGESVKALASNAIDRTEIKVVGSTLRPLRAGVFKASGKEFDDYFYLRAPGWAERESWGVWSLGSASQVVFQRPRLDGCTLSIEAEYLRPGMPSLVSVNGGAARRLEDGPIAIPPTGEVVTIELRHPDVRSPKQLGLNEDTRDVALGLKQITVECGTALVGSR